MKTHLTDSGVELKRPEADLLNLILNRKLKIAKVGCHSFDPNLVKILTRDLVVVLNYA